MATLETLYVVLAAVGVAWISLLIGAFIYWRGTLRNNPFPKVGVSLPTLKALWSHRSPSTRLEHLQSKRNEAQAQLEQFAQRIQQHMRQQARGNGR